MNAIEIENLVKVYDTNVKALLGVSLSVKKGDFYALLGPNGAGKSTTIGIICSLVRKTSGKVRIFGHDIDTDLIQAKRQLGLVPQEFNFNQFEKVEHILVNQAGYYGIEREEAKRRAKKYLSQLDLWEKRDKQAFNLSGGMKRQLMIARALMHDPKLLVLDEPTAGIDIELRRSMWVFLKEINQRGVTIILTTHYLEEAEILCRNIGIINRGILIEDTTMKDLLKKLDVETFILDLAPESKVVHIKGVKWQQINDHTLEVEVHKSTSLSTVFKQLSVQNIEVLSMRNKVNRLEELFISMVHKSMEMKV
ncbi:ABC transporter ATP-binding protein [Candidatus Enterovibrio escicola]|uniref:ABC-type multidrug transport system, ATPase component n=1 Tax=Candidatus Enterovibrio escicola TaxID=1927127 RepID=A0A2A5T083_9GAMM|nr:ABC transporter ATP-binding protein [Candidatus Enterovibrio escacola]PCS21556.1 ABC-type multidrug transport system, ATPase component [Candidatus Enterovibrio escacola]